MSTLNESTRGKSPAELGRWLSALRPSEMTALLADLALAVPDTFEASRRRVVAPEVTRRTTEPGPLAADER
jgi:anti-sigma factor ChrR (cupin superfamily)